MTMVAASFRWRSPPCSTGCGAASARIAGLVIAAIGLAVASLGLRYGLGITKEHGIQTSLLIVSAATLFSDGRPEHLDHGYLKAFCVMIGSGVGFAARYRVGIPIRRRAGVDILILSACRSLRIRVEVRHHAAGPFVVAAIAGTCTCWVLSVPHRESMTPIGCARISLHCPAACPATAPRRSLRALSAASESASTRLASDNGRQQA